MIEISDLSYDIEGVSILRGVSLTLDKGGVIALVGPNGAGKSTMLSLMARLLPLQKGRVQIDGLDVQATDSRALAKRMAILPQSVNAASRLSVRDLVGFGRYPYHRGRPGAQDAELIDQSLAFFDLLGLADRQLDMLSGGQRQRAFVAMAYAQDTDYLLLDEPLNNLDLAASRALMTRLRDLADSSGRTVVIVLHDINFATAYADRIIALKDGAIAADGTPQEVVTAAMLQDVFNTPAEVEIIANRPVVLV